MSFSTRASTAVFSSLQEGAWEAMSVDPQPVTGGFDVLNVVFMADFRATPKTALEIVAMFRPGMRYGGTDFWLREVRPACVGGNVWRADCRFEGRVSADKPPHLAISAAASADSMFITAPSGSGVGATTYSNYWLPFPITLQPGGGLSLAIRENVPAFEYSYVHIGEPRTHLIGAGELGGTVRVSPPVRLESRRFPWDDFTSNTWRINIPAGWVFDDLRADTIDGTNPKVSYVTEAWVQTSLYKPQA
jgi:hypothetical protein